MTISTGWRIMAEAELVPSHAGARARDLADVYELGASLAFEALTKMGEAMRDETASEKARRAAARDVMYVFSRLPEPTKPSDPEDESTKRTRTLEMLRAVADGNAPPQLAELLNEAGLVISRRTK